MLLLKVTECNLTAKNEIILKGKFKTNQLIYILSSYMKKYVLCSSCNSYKTILEKKEGIDYLHCTLCKSINPISL